MRALLSITALSLLAASLQAQQGARVMAVFAHPDDERVVAPLLHRLSREGREVHLVIATDGSRGVREHAGIAAGKPLADARKLESECSAKRIGARLHMIGLEDGALASFTNLGRLREEVAAAIARVRPVAIITFGPEGGTGHPDHRLTGNVVTQVVQQDTLYRGIDLFYAQLPTERLRTAPRASPTVNGIADSLLTVRVPIDEQDLVAGRESFGCHRTQYTPDEMRAVNAYLAHVFNGVNYLRPWNGRLRDPAGIFTR